MCSNRRRHQLIIFASYVVHALSEDAAPSQTIHPSFPPSELPGVVKGGPSQDSDEVAEWFIDNVANKPMIGPPFMTEREKYLAKLSVAEWIELRKSGNATCQEYAEALTKRATHYKDMNWFMYWDILPDMMDKVVKEAQKMDDRVAHEGIENIAPLYCLPVPVKGTMSTVDYPSSSGAGPIHDVYGVKDAAAVEKLKEGSGIGFAKTNVPEFAASWVTCNYKNGCALNPHDLKYTTGGSSGGSGAAVAAYVAPIAFTEDTGGSTRHPSAQNGVYGYDPSRNHYPNAGNPGMTYLCDQVGVNARSVDDIIAFDGAFLGTTALHEEASLTTPDISKLRIGVPQWPFVEFQRPASDFPMILSPAAPAKKRVAANVENKWMATIAALRKAGATIVDEEWPDRDQNGLNDLAQSMFETGFKSNFDGLVSLLHSFTGQVHEWMRTYLNSTVSVKELIGDSYSFGGGFSPASFFALSPLTDESHFRYAVSQWVFDSIDAWNSLFDIFNLDFIMVPTSFCTNITYACVGNSSCTMRYSTNATDPLHDVPANILDCNSVSLYGWKFIPIAKLAFPVGKDPDGNPVSMQLLARSGPKQEDCSSSRDRTWIFDDDFATTHDIPILHKAKTIVDAIARADPSLTRTEPALVSVGNDNLFSSTTASS